MSINGAFQRLKLDNPEAAHRIYGKVLVVVEIRNRRNGKSDIVTGMDFAPDYNDEFFIEETDKELFDSLQVD